MGNTQSLRGRFTPAILVVALVALAVVAALGAFARPAAAQTSFTTCASCHTSAKHSSNSTHAALYSSNSCTSCHANGFSAENKGVTPKACAACHDGVTAILGKNTHTTIGCGTTPGCHGVPSPTPTATATSTPTPTPTATSVATALTARVSPSIVKLGKKVKITGTAGPVASLAGAKIAFKVQRRVGTKWVKMKAPASATISSTGTYTWSYKAVKKGAHKVTLSIKPTAAFTAKTMIRNFKVK